MNVGGFGTLSEEKSTLSVSFQPFCEGSMSGFNLCSGRGTLF